MATTTGAAPRRRPSSSLLVRAAVLLSLAASVAVGAVVAVVVTGTTSPWPVAAGLVVLALGAAATRSTHLEVRVTRREGAKDRATLARDYRALAEARTAEDADFADAMRRRVDDAERAGAEQLATIHAHEAALDHRERRIASVEAELDLLKDRLAGTELLARTQSTRADDLAARLAAAEAGAERVSADVARVTALEAERDALRAELHLWQSAGARRRQA